jgi:type I restriction enzyme, S subunit
VASFVAHSVALKKEVFVKAGRKVYEQKNAIQRDATIGTYYIDEAKFRDLQRFSLSPGDFIVSCAGTIGRIFRVPIDAQPGVINQALLKLRIDDAVVCSDYFYHYFDWDKFQQRIVDNTHGGAMQNLVGMSLFRSVELALPPVPEQRAIAAALSDVDALLGGLDRLIAKKRDLKQAAMQQLLTGQTRLPGFHGEWEVKSLAATCSMKSGEGITSAKIDQYSQYPCYGGNGLRGFTSRFTHEGRYALIGRQGALCGNVFGVDGQFFASEHAIVVTASERTDIGWLTYVLGSMNLNQYSESSAQPGLSVSKISTLDIAVPPTKDEQTAIAGALSDMDAELSALGARRDKTRALKQGMMQELLTGKTRLVPAGGAHA